MSRNHGTKLAALLAALAVVLTACGGDSGDAKDKTSTKSASAGNAKDKTIVVGAANFAENQILAHMYAKVLTKAGFKTKVQTGDLTRETLSTALQAGDIHLTPEYVGTDTEYWNKEINGAKAKALASSDVKKSAAALRKLLAAKGLVAYEPSPAADQNAFAVTKKTAAKHKLAKMSDLGKVASQLTLGGPAECPKRPFCQPGLQKTYGAKFKEFKALDAGGPLTINALTAGKIDVGLVFSSDGSVAAKGLVVLADDKKLQTADNIIPVLRKDVDSAELKAALNALSAKLTTKALQSLNKAVTVDKKDPDEVAEAWLKKNGLL
jgi:osmoprotectant transport system substrate-binding protein